MLHLIFFTCSLQNEYIFYGHTEHANNCFDFPGQSSSSTEKKSLHIDPKPIPFEPNDWGAPGGNDGLDTIS